MTVTTAEIMRMFSHSGCRRLLLLAGPPCQPFSGLELQHSWSDPRADPPKHTINLVSGLRLECQHQNITFKFLVEEVASMPAKIREEVSDGLGMQPCVVHAGDWGYVHRARLGGA